MEKDKYLDFMNVKLSHQEFFRKWRRLMRVIHQQQRRKRRNHPHIPTEKHQFRPLLPWIQQWFNELYAVWLNKTWYD